MKIGNVEFISKSEYMAGLRDSGRIELLKTETDLKDPASAAALYRQLKNQPFYFETEVGKEFIRELLRKTRPSDRGVGVGIRRRGYYPTQEEEERVRCYEERRKVRIEESIRILGQEIDENNPYKSLIPDEYEMVPKRRPIRNRNLPQKNVLEKNKTKQKNISHFAKKEKKKAILLLVGILSSIVLTYCLSDEMAYRIQSYASERKMEAVQNSVLQPVKTESLVDSNPVMERVAMVGTKNPVMSDTSFKLAGGTPSDSDILPEYKALYEQNQDLIGWIRIPDTQINYPVMQTKEDMEFYLNRDFNREDDVNGLPFLDSRCDINKPSTNLLIYGHSMNNGSMFATLKEYKDPSFYEQHPTILFDTIMEHGEYEIIAVFQSRVAYVEEITFRYYNFIQADTEAEFNSFLSAVEQLSYYDIGKTAHYGDQLLTLSTCDREIEDGRLVVLARKVSK